MQNRFFKMWLCLPFDVSPAWVQSECLSSTTIYLFIAFFPKSPLFSAF